MGWPGRVSRALWRMSRGRLPRRPPGSPFAAVGRCQLLPVARSASRKLFLLRHRPALPAVMGPPWPRVPRLRAAIWSEAESSAVAAFFGHRFRVGRRHSLGGGSPASRLVRGQVRDLFVQARSLLVARLSLDRLTDLTMASAHPDLMPAPLGPWIAAWMSIAMAMNVTLQDGHPTPLRKVAEDVDQPMPLGPYPAAAMTVHPVSTRAHRPTNDDPRCVEAVDC